MNKIGLFDMDGSLADFDRAMRRDLNKLRSPLEPEITGDIWALEKQDHIKERMKLIKSHPGWWLDLEPLPEGFWVMEQARQIGFEIHVLTKGPSNHSIGWKEKLEWCHKHIGKDNAEIHIVSNKGLVYGNFLYDDFPEYMEKWLQHRPRGLGIMPVNDANQNYKHNQVIKWDGKNEKEIINALKVEYNRVEKVYLENGTNSANIN